MRETGGGIVEVNAAPGFRMHTHPTEGEAQYVAKPVIDMLFPPGAPSRIPIVAVTGSNGKTTTARMIAHIMKGMGRKVGLTSTDGIYVDGRIVRRADASGPKSASMVLQNPTVDFAVFEVARGGILREGLGYHRNDVAVVLNVTGDHLGLGGIHSIKQLAEVKRVVVEAVPRDGVAVLNADDQLVAAMRRHTSGSVIYFSMDPEHDRLKFQASRGRRAVTLEQGRNGEMIVLRQGRKSMSLVWTHLIPATFEGRARMNVQNALAATAASWAAGAHLHDIRQGLRTFTTSLLHGSRPPEHVRARRLPCRRRLRPQPAGHGGARASSSSSSASRRRAGRAHRVTGRHIGVMATAGDRRDEDIVELGRVAARYFDEIIVREDENNRGRPRGDTAALIAAGHRVAPARAADGIGHDDPRRARGDPARRSTWPARATWSWSASTTPTRSGRSSSAASTAAPASRTGCAPWSASSTPTTRSSSSSDPEQPLQLAHARQVDRPIALAPRASRTARIARRAP